MALLLLLSTVSWKVEKHYCMGRLMDVTLFTDAESCGMDMSMAIVEDNVGETKNSCCDDEVVFVEGQDDLKISFNDLELEQQSFLVAFTNFYYNSFLDFSNRLRSNEKYPPPNLVRDIQLLDQVFLI